MSKRTSYVAYLRVSTHKQGIDGLGIDVQRKTIENFIRPGDKVLRYFTEVESGSHDQRPELLKALDMCKVTGATLLIAKLDRLARDVHFVSGLMKHKVDFLCCDMPDAGNFLVHITAAYAEEERRQISERTKAALGRARDRGTKLGGYRGTPPTDATRRKARVALDDKRKEYIKRVCPLIEEVWHRGIRSFGVIATELNEREVPSPNGKQWTRASMRRFCGQVWKGNPHWLSFFGDGETNSPLRIVDEEAA